MNKIKVISILILLIFINSKSYSKENLFIIYTVNDELITSIDVKKESIYLVALNNQLKNLNKKKILEIAEESILRETIKRIELNKFFDLIANTALINQLKIKSIKKLKEDSYKEAKPTPQDAGPQYKIEYDIYENYVQSSFVINFEGNFKDYISFIYDIKNSNKGLLTETSKITKSVNGNLKILSTLTINFVNNS